MLASAFVIGGDGRFGCSGRLCQVFVWVRSSEPALSAPCNSCYAKLRTTRAGVLRWSGTIKLHRDRQPCSSAGVHRISAACGGHLAASVWERHWRSRSVANGKPFQIVVWSSDVGGKVVSFQGGNLERELKTLRLTLVPLKNSVGEYIPLLQRQGTWCLSRVRKYFRQATPSCGSSIRMWLELQSTLPDSRGYGPTLILVNASPFSVRNRKGRNCAVAAMFVSACRLSFCGERARASQCHRKQQLICQMFARNCLGA